MNHVRKGNNVLLIFGEHGQASKKENQAQKEWKA
jgi:hypothetical protein